MLIPSFRSPPSLTPKLESNGPLTGHTNPFPVRAGGGDTGTEGFLGGITAIFPAELTDTATRFVVLGGAAGRTTVGDVFAFAANLGAGLADDAALAGAGFAITSGAGITNISPNLIV